MAQWQTLTLTLTLTHLRCAICIAPFALRRIQIALQLPWTVDTARRANEQIQTAADDVTAFVMGKLRLLDALIRRILPVRLDAPDSDAPDAYYPNPTFVYASATKVRVLC